jgi:CO/xanthine dehydrogenase Mo-binding subunit
MILLKINCKFYLRISIFLPFLSNYRYTKYKIGFDTSGKLLGIMVDWYSDVGYSYNDTFMAEGPGFVDNVYSCKNWHIINNLVRTNLPANTYVRSK